MVEPRVFGTKDLAIIILLLTVAGACIYIAFLPPVPCAGCNAKTEFVFSPDAQGDVISFIQSAQESVDIEMYVFTSQDIIRELGDAQARGVKVRVILEPRVTDSRQPKTFELLRNLGVDVKWASMTYKLTHSKFIIVDGKKALVGSINFSMSALNSNREAAAVVEGDVVQEVVSAFEEDWQIATDMKKSTNSSAEE